MSDRPLLLDLFCGAGGCAAGYRDAGFDLVGVDHRPQPRYPCRFVQADALVYLRHLLTCPDRLGFDVIHASPPCQAYSIARNISGGRKQHPELIPETRTLLEQTGRLWVIENVPGAPLQCPAIVCGLALGLAVKRHRLFESNILLLGTQCPAGHRGNYLSITGRQYLAKLGHKSWVSVHGGGAPRNLDTRRRANVATARIAMGIDWMTRDELSQSIPPAYTKYIGTQLYAALRR